MQKKILTGLLLYWTCISMIYGQDGPSYISSYNSPDKFRDDLLIISSLTVSTLALGTIACFPGADNNESINFHFNNDNSGYLQVDKFIHSYYSYVITNTWYQGLRRMNTNNNLALFTSGAIGCMLLIPKEILDGYSLDGGFSWGDMLANITGPALFVSQELLFDDQLFKYKFSFSKSDYVDQSNGYLGKTFVRNYFRDYNGHTYWLSINANKIIPLKKIPDWINIAVGYSANGMFGQYENKRSYNGVIIPETERYRQFLLSLDIDWSRINVESKFLRALLNGINLIKIPFPAFEINSKGNIKGYWIYF